MNELDERWQRLLTHLQHHDPGSVPELFHLVYAIQQGEEGALSEDACRQLLPAYVAAELEGLDVATLYPQISQHLERSRRLAREYDILMDQALAQEMDAIVTLPRLPPITLPTTPPVTRLEYLQMVADRMARGWIEPRQREYQGVITSFLTRLRGLSESFSFQPTPTLSESPSVVQLLIVTYATNQHILQNWTIAQVDKALVTDTLEERVREEAQRIAEQYAFMPQAAQQFAVEYAAGVAQQPHELRNLLKKGSISEP